MKILLVDDDQCYRDIFSRTMHGQGFEIVYAEGLTQALNIIDRENFDCLLLDPGLPDSIPSETVKTVMERNPSATAIVISGSTDPETMAAALKAGAHAYLIKGKNDLRGSDIAAVIKDAVLRCKVKAANG